MSSLVMALFSAGLLGVADFLGGVATRRVPVVAVTLAVQAVALAGLAAAALGVAPAAWHPADLAWGAAAGVAIGIGLPLFYRGLAGGAMSVIAPTTAVTAAAVPVLAGLGLGERPTPPAAAGVALGIVAIGLIAHRGPAAGLRRPGRGSGLVTALAAGLAFGVFYLLLDRTSPASGLAPLVAARGAAIVLLAGVAVTTGGPILARAAPRLIVGAGLLDGAGSVLFLLAVQRGPLVLVGVLASLYPVATILLARAIDGERMTPLQVAGLAGAVVAVGLIVGG